MLEIGRTKEWLWTFNDVGAAIKCGNPVTRTARWRRWWPLRAGGLESRVTRRCRNVRAWNVRSFGHLHGSTSALVATIDRHQPAWRTLTLSLCWLTGGRRAQPVPLLTEECRRFGCGMESTSLNFTSVIYAACWRALQPATSRPNNEQSVFWRFIIAECRCGVIPASCTAEKLGCMTDWRHASCSKP